MSPKYSAQERLKLIERVILGGEPVIRVCQEAGISRVLFYRWLKRYKESPGITEVLTPGRRKPATTQLRQGLIGQVEGRKIRILSPEEKLELIKRVESGEEVADVCREAGISRTIFYRWKKRYEQAPPEEKIRSLAPRVPHIKRYWRQAPEKYERAVLSLVAQHPEYGVRRLVANLPRVAGVSIVGHHGVQNILRRHNLSLYEQRLAYAQAQVTLVIKLISAFEEFFARFFVFPIETRQAIIRFFGITALSTFVTVAFLGILGYFVTFFGQAAPSYRLGLFFASVALLMGSFFFLYSMKYYFTLALVLSFSTQGGLGNGNGNSHSNGLNGYNGGFSGWLKKIFGLNGNGGVNGNSNGKVIPAGGLQPNLSHIKLKRYPFISIHLPFYNEKKVANRILSACTSFDYPNYEVIVCDDSTDETVQIVNEWKNHPRVKILHRSSREGFKGGALKYALQAMDPKIVLVQSDANGITALETVQQYINTLATDSDTSYTDQDYLNQFDLSNFGVFPTLYFESTLKTSAGTGYASLINTVNDTAITGSEISTTSTSYTRVRSGDISLNLPRIAANMDTQLKNSASGTTSASSSWLILQISNLPTSGGTGYAELFECGDSTCSTGSSVSGSEVSTTNADFTRVRSSSITLTTGKDYVVRLKSAIMANAKIVLVQSDANGITALETVQQYINTLATDSDTSYTGQDYLNQFDLSNFGVFPTLYFESTLKTSAGTGYASLINNVNDTAITGSEISTTSTSYTRVRSGDISLNLPRIAANMDTQLKNSASGTTSVSNSWLIVQVSGLMVPEKVLFLIPFIIFLPKLVEWWQKKKIAPAIERVQVRLP